MKRLIVWPMGLYLLLVSACIAFQNRESPIIQPNNVSNLEPVLEFAGSGVATSLAFHPNDPVLAVGWKDGSVTLIDFAEQRIEILAEPNGETPAYVIFSPDGSQIVTGNGNGVVLWDFATRETKSLMTETPYVLSLSFDAKGERLAAIGLGKTWVWDIQAGSVQLNCACNDEFFLFNPGGEGWGVSGSYFDMAWHDDTTLKWQASIWNAQPAGDIIDGEIETATFSADGGFLAAFFRNQGIRIWNAQVKQPTLSLEPGLVATSLAFSPDNRLLAASVLPGSIELWDLQKSEHRISLSGVSLPHAVAFSPDGRFLATGTEGQVTFWAVP